MRRVREGDAMANRRPWLAGALVLVVGAIALFVSGHDVAALTVLVGAFLTVAVAKRAG
ncbi:MAG: hypothetical protein QOE45_805 [Frankiaceae bacterium]|jgi:uncharacterized membrane protein HdeD (DUF308 family)|nr:hypothetical protein [Frankiaceae bacterium]